jgi:serine/threonine-protein kinase RsbW
LPSGRDAARPFRLDLASNLEDVASAGAAVRDYAAAVGLDAHGIDDLELATVEAANNIVIHGYRGATDRRYRLIITIAPGELHVALSDNGEGIAENLLAAPLPAWNAEAESGRGIAIIRACTDRIDYRRRRGRNRLLLVKRIATTAG